MNKDKRNNIKLLGTLTNADESGIIANANQIYDDVQQKAQETINSELIEAVGTGGNVDSKIASAVDEVHKRSNYNDGDNIIDFNTIHIITDNPEFVCVAVDANNKILYGIKTDGQPYFGVGCPQQVKDYIDKQINKILGTDDVSSTIDSLKEIEAFLKDFTNSDTLKALLDTKANKVDVDNAIADINTNIAEVRKRSNYNDGDNIIDFNTIHIIKDNPEFAIAVVDINDRILYGIKADGQPYWGVGVPKVVRDYVDKQVNDILCTDNITETIDSLKEVEKFLSDFKNSDTLKALLDTKANKTDVDNTIAAVNADIADKYKKSNPNDEEGNVIDTNSIKSVINNPDYLIAWVDKDNKIIFAIQHDGNPYFGYGVPKDVDAAIASAVATETSRAQEAEANRYTKNETYTKEEVNNLISTKTQIGDVFDISAYHATGGTLATYNNLEDALGTNGKNVPQSLRKGGMSVKFVQSSDNKYVQCRLMSKTFNTNVTQWQGVDDVPTAGSDNLVKSGGVAKIIEDKINDLKYKIIGASDATLSITTLTTEVGKYYRLDVAVETLTVTLPAITDLTTVRTVVVYLTAGTTPAVTITSADSKDVYYQDGFEIKAGNTYEINCLSNGAAWIVAAVKINTSNS